MPRFRLHYNNQEVLLPIGEFVIGRGMGCDLLLDDPMASRRHGMFQASNEKLYVEDLGSRNGVKVNGKVIKGRVELANHDMVTIGGQDFKVVATNDASAIPARKLAATLPGTAGENTTALGMRAALIEKAFAVGRIEDVEHILQSFLTATMAEFRSGKADPELLGEVTKYALRLTGETGKTKWLDWVFDAHLAAGRLLPGPTVDELYSIARRVHYPITPQLRAYVDWVRTQTPNFSPSERFVQQRIEGLLRVLLA